MESSLKMMTFKEFLKTRPKKKKLQKPVNPIREQKKLKRVYPSGKFVHFGKGKMLVVLVGQKHFPQFYRNGNNLIFSI